jgi:hypothetical protein
VDFPIIDLRDEDACYATVVQWLHPEGMAGPKCGRNDRRVVHRRGHAPGPGLSLRSLPASLPCVHRHGLARRQASAQRTGPDRPRVRPGRPHRPTGPRTGLRPLGVAQPQAPTARPGVPESRPVATGRPGFGGRRDLPGRGGKKACRTATRTIHRVGGRTRHAATALGTTTALRSAEWWAGRAVRSA